MRKTLAAIVVLTGVVSFFAVPMPAVAQSNDQAFLQILLTGAQEKERSVCDKGKSSFILLEGEDVDIYQLTTQNGNSYFLIVDYNHDRRPRGGAHRFIVDGGTPPKTKKVEREEFITRLNGESENLFQHFLENPSDCVKTQK